MSAHDTAYETARLEGLYAQVPALRCKGLCQSSCGPVPMAAAEWSRIQAHLGAAAPQATAFAAPGPPSGVVGMVPVVDDDLTCPLLDRDTGRCSVYRLRPLLCRLWGVAAGMPCGFGCEPARRLPDAEARALLQEAMVGTGDAAPEQPA